MNVVDSSGWLEYFVDGANAKLFASAIEAIDNLLVPTITIYEVFKRTLHERGESAATQVAVQMQQATVIELSATLAIAAAQFSATQRLPMADSIILASARAYGAILWTQDADFDGIEGVRYFRKRQV